MKTIETISIPVADQEKAKEFYVQKLGFSVLFEAVTPQGHWIQLGIPKDNTSITLVNGPHHAAPGTVKGTIIGTDNIAKDVEVLRSKGVKMQDVQNFPHGKITTFADPDGNQWVLREAPKHH